jgi:hypothetical protein
MAEIPTPYGPKKKKSDIERVAHFMNGFLGIEMLEDIPYPKHLRICLYDELTNEEKKEWYEYTFGAVLKDATFQVAGFLGRALRAVEINLIKRRIADPFKKAGIEYDKE